MLEFTGVYAKNILFCRLVGRQIKLNIFGFSSKMDQFIELCCYHIHSIDVISHNLRLIVFWVVFSIVDLLLQNIVGMVVDTHFLHVIIFD